jgi:hypothetical protein
MPALVDYLPCGIPRTAGWSRSQDRRLARSTRRSRAFRRVGYDVRRRPTLARSSVKLPLLLLILFGIVGAPKIAVHSFECENEGSIVRHVRFDTTQRRKVVRTAERPNSPDTLIGHIVLSMKTMELLEWTSRQLQSALERDLQCTTCADHASFGR